MFAARSRALKLRYISRLFSKELILRNFPGVPIPETLERMVELSLYTEEDLQQPISVSRAPQQACHL